MKTSVFIVISSIVLTIGLSSVSLGDRKYVNKECGVNPDDTVIAKEELSSKYLKVDVYGTEIPSPNKGNFFFIRGDFARETTMEMLKNASVVDDVVPRYPTNWVKDYHSVEILHHTSNKKRKAVSPNNVLSKEQKKLLNSLDVNDNFNVIVNYKTENIVTGKSENRELSVLLTVIPEVQAEYNGGYDKMLEYLEKGSDDRISLEKIRNSQMATVLFTVNEEGFTEEVQMKETTGNNEMDRALIDLVETMPKWNPAQDIKGNNVKQQFQLVYGMDGC